MSLPAPVGTSASIQDIGVMECLTAGTILTSETVVGYQLTLFGQLCYFIQRIEYS